MEIENTTRVWIKYKLQGNGSDSWECQLIDPEQDEVSRYMEYDQQVVLDDINLLDEPERTQELTRLNLI